MVSEQSKQYFEFGVTRIGLTNRGELSILGLFF